MNGDETLDAALTYLAYGWAVLPLCPPDHVGTGREHRGCKSPGKRPFFPGRPPGQSGEWKEFQARVPTEAEVRGWWAAHPRLNVGAALGPVSGLAGVDVDDEDGEAVLRELAGGEPTPTWEYTTGKGRRLLYRLAPGVTVANAVFKRPGTEIEILRFMSQGGQVVLPPSVHPNGAIYRWVPGRGPDDVVPADAPAWLTAPTRPEAATAARPGDGELITAGGRNNYLTSLAGAMRKRGADEHVILAALAATNETRLDPPLTADEVRAVARSVARYAPDEFTAVTFTPPVPGRVPETAPGGERWFKWASELSAPAKADEWLWRGYLPKGAITLLSALWKAGKTTLLSHLLRAFAAGGEFLGQPIRGCKVLYVSEEGEQHWVRRRDDLGIGDHAGFALQPFAAKPCVADWLGFLGKVRAAVREHGFELVVFDTLAKLWPVTEENDAGQVDAALMPLWEVTKAGAGVLLIHHLRKSGGQEYTGSRGSGALSAFPDIIVELTRFDAGNVKDRKRVLRAKGRYEETPDELVMELIDGVYRHVPDEVGDAVPTAVVDATGAVTALRVPDAKSDEDRVLAVLRAAKTPWLTADGIREGIRAHGWAVRDATVSTILSSLIHRVPPVVLMTGKPRSPKDPQRYGLAERVGSHSTPAAPGGVAGMTLGNDSPETPAESHSRESFPPQPRGGRSGMTPPEDPDPKPETDPDDDAKEVE